MKQVAAMALTLGMAGAVFGQTQSSIATSQFSRLRNAGSGTYLRTDNGLSIGRVEQGWWSGQWEFERVDDGVTYWRMKNRWTSQYLHLENPVLAMGAIMPGWWSAQWHFERNSNGSYWITNRWRGLSLQVQNGALVATPERPNAPTALWNIEDSNTPPNAGIKENSYHLQVTHSEKCVDIAGAALTPGQPVIQYDCNSQSANQIFIERFVDGPWAMYIATHSGRCLEVSEDGKRPGAPLIQETCDPNNKKQWFRSEPVEPNSNKDILIAHVSGLCLDIDSFSRNNDARVLQWHCTRAANQRFTRTARPVTKVEPAVQSTLQFVNQNVLGIEDPDPEVCWKNTVTRGVGTIPNACPAGFPDYDGGLVCYEGCRPGFKGAAFVCWQTCPAGYTDIGVSCAKPAPYGRGAGYPWKFGDPLNDSGMFARCEAAHGRGNCEKYGLIVYPKCAPGYHAVGANICSPSCPPGMRDDGAFCAKQSYTRSSRTTVCPAGKENDAGLCYTPCPSQTSPVGPICWGKCGGDYPVSCAAACARSISACTFSIIEQVSSTAEVALNVGLLAVGAGAAKPAISAATNAAKLAGKRTLTKMARQELKDQLTNDLKTLKNLYDARKSMQNAKVTLDSAASDAEYAELLVKAYEEGTFDVTELLPKTVADFDPTGIFGVIRAFYKPVCK